MSERVPVGRVGRSLPLSLNNSYVDAIAGPPILGFRMIVAACWMANASYHVLARFSRSHLI
jgi:hypothetical protein